MSLVIAVGKWIGTWSSFDTSRIRLDFAGIRFSPYLADSRHCSSGTLWQRTNGICKIWAQLSLPAPHSSENLVSWTRSVTDDAISFKICCTLSYSSSSSLSGQCCLPCISGILCCLHCCVRWKGMKRDTWSETWNLQGHGKGAVSLSSSGV